MTVAAKAHDTAQKRSGLPLATLFKMAWRNLWRQKRRTQLLMTVVAYATMAVVLFWALYDGFFDSMMLGNARYLGASVLVEQSRYKSDPDPSNALTNLHFLAALSGQSGVRAAAERLDFPALARSSYVSQGVLARGVDPQQEGQVSNIPSRITQGHMLSGMGEAVLGQKLAENLDVRLNERLVLNVSGKGGMQAAGLKVVGLVKSGIAPIDEGTLLVSLDQARALTGVPTATSVALDVARGKESAVARAVQPLLPAGVQAYDLNAQLGAVGTIMKEKAGSMGLIGGLFSLFAALAVTSTVLVSVLERTREFGMEMAVGMRPGQVALMVTIEAVTATVLGWLVGLLLGYSIAAIFAHWNILGHWFASYGEVVQAMGTGDEIYMALKPIYALYASLTIVAAALFSLWIPAKRVRGLNPAEAMRAD